MKTSVVVYSRRGCHLCENAESVVEKVREEHDFELEIIYVDGDPSLEKVYGEEVPVTLINGRRHDYFRIDALRFRTAILLANSNT